MYDIPLVFLCPIVLVFKLPYRIALEDELSDVLELALLARDIIQVSQHLQLIAFQRQVGQPRKVVCQR